jgi:hypothetical protein
MGVVGKTQRLASLVAREAASRATGRLSVGVIAASSSPSPAGIAGARMRMASEERMPLGERDVLLEPRAQWSRRVSRGGSAGGGRPVDPGAGPAHAGGELAPGALGAGEKFAPCARATSPGNGSSLPTAALHPPPADRRGGGRVRESG